MKRVLRTTGIMGLALVSPLFAIERPTAADTPKERGDVVEAPELEEADMPKAKGGNEAKMAWLGVAGSPISETLSYHLGIEAGSGISLELVAPDSPAEAAGLKPHDVITKLGGKQVDSMNDLRDFMKASKPGDEVETEVYSRGKLEKRKLKLKLRPDDLPIFIEPENDNRAQLRKFMINPDAMPKNLFQGMDDKERKMIENMLNGRFKDLQKEFDDLRLNFDALPGEDGARMKRMKFNFHDLMQGAGKVRGRTSIRMSDGDGTSYQMQETEDGRELEVKDRHGKLLFAGPYNTEGDKEAVPDELREKIKKFGLDDNSKQGRFQFRRIRPNRR